MEIAGANDMDGKPEGVSEWEGANRLIFEPKLPRLSLSRFVSSLRELGNDDGDLHLVMENTDGRRGRIVVELPVGRPWCKLRTSVFAWTNARFTLSMHVTRHPIVTVVGRAFYDVDHASRNPRANRRDYDRHLAVWEIHPVMRFVSSDI